MKRFSLLAVAGCVLCGVVLVAKLPRPVAPEPPPDPRATGTAAAPVPAAAPVELPPVPPPAVEPFPPLVRFGDSRLRHPAPVKSLALTTDGSTLLTATREEPVIRLWDVKSGRLLRAVRVEDEYTASMTVLALTPDGTKAFVMRHQWRQRASESHRWHEPATVDLATGAVVRWPLGDESENLHPVFALSPDGKTLAGIVRGELRVWDFATGAPRSSGALADWSNLIGNIGFSPDGKQIAVGGARAAFYVAPVDGSAPPRRIAVNCQKEDVRAVFWPEPNRVVALWYRGLAAHDPATGAELARADLGDDVNMLPPHIRIGDTLLVAQGHSRGPSEIDLATLASDPTHAFRNCRRDTYTASADGRVLAVVTDHAVRVFDASGKSLHPDLEGVPFAPLARLHVAPDGTRLLGCTDHTAHAWELPDGRARAGFDGRASWSMTHFALSPDGRFATGGFTKDGNPLAVDLQTGREIALPRGDAEDGTNQAVGFADNNRVWLWNRKANTFTPVEVGTNRGGDAVPGFPRAVYVAASPDGRRVAAAGWGGLAIRDLNGTRGWEVLDTYEERMRQPRCGLSPPPCGIPVRFSACGRWLLVHDHGLELWDIRKHPVRVGNFDTHTGGGEWTWRDAAFSPDGRRLASAVRAKDGATELCVWETASAAEVFRFRPARGVAGCAFTPDGRRLVIAHSDTTLGVWDWAAVEARQLGDVPAGTAWRELANRDAKQAHAALRTLAAHPDRALAVLAPAFAPPSAAELNPLLAALGGDDFTARENAQRALAALGQKAEPALRAAASQSDSPEVRTRATELLKALGPTDGRLAGERLRAVRAVEVLERVASPGARALLATWAAEPNTPLGAEAATALARMPKP